MPKPNKTVIITGTHITPAIELINQLKADNTTNWIIHYIGRQYTSPIEKIPAIEFELIPKMGINYHIIDCGKFDRRYWPNTVMGLPKTIKGIFQAIKYVGQIRPDIVISFGGYLSVPVIIASKFYSIKSITHEQTFTISLSTKLNSYFANKVALSFENPSLKQLPLNKAVVTGNLLRSDLYKNQSPYYESLIKTNKPILYITAGSQGSHKINQAILRILPQLVENFNIIHQTGKFDYDDIKSKTSSMPNYFPIDYITPDNIGWVFHNANIVISRAGANTIHEISHFGTKSIIIPLPVTQQDEQKLNANWLKSQLAHKVIIADDLKLTPESLLEDITRLSRIEDHTNHQPVIKPNYKLLHLIHEIS